MSVSVWVGNSFYPIGAASFLKSFFSTLYVRLERERWGSLFPVIMREFYSGKMSHERAEAAIAELQTIRDLLASLSPDDLVWDFENRDAFPPGGDISPEVTSLANAFVTSDGKDLFEQLLRAFNEAKKKKKDATIT